MTQRVKKILSITAICLIIIIGTFVASLTFTHHPKATAPPDNKPAFSFDQSNAPEWWSGGNNWPDIDDYTGGQITEADLPIADISVLKGTKSKPGECFVMAYYNKGSIDVATALKKKESEILMGESDSSLLKQIGTQELSMETPEGKKKYTMFQYDYNKPQIQRGNEFGFIPLRSGHIEVRGICATADQLSKTLSPLAAIKLNP